MIYPDFRLIFLPMKITRQCVYVLVVEAVPAQQQRGNMHVVAELVPEAGGHGGRRGAPAAALRERRGARLARRLPARLRAQHAVHRARSRAHRVTHFLKPILSNSVHSRLYPTTYS